MISIGIQQSTKPITEVHAIISRDSKGSEGVITATQHHHTFPMLTSNPELIETMKKIVKDLVMGKPELKDLTFHVVKYTNKEVVENL